MSSLQSLARIPFQLRHGNQNPLAKTNRFQIAARMARITLSRETPSFSATHSLNSPTLFEFRLIAKILHAPILFLETHETSWYCSL